MILVVQISHIPCTIGAVDQEAEGRSYFVGNLKRVTQGKIAKGIGLKIARNKVEKATPGFVKINTRTKAMRFPRGGLRHVNF